MSPTYELEDRAAGGGGRGVHDGELIVTTRAVLDAATEDQADPALFRGTR